VHKGSASWPTWLAFIGTTVEFGLLQQADGLRIYALALPRLMPRASSPSTTPRPTGSVSTWSVCSEPTIGSTNFQETYFVIRGLDELLDLAHIDFGPIYEQAQGKPEFAAGEVLETDAFIHRGTGTYHRAQRQGAEHGQ